MKFADRLVELCHTIDDINKHYRSFSPVLRVSGTEERSVHVSPEAFLDMFGSSKYITSSREELDNDFFIRYSIWYNGVRFFCITGHESLEGYFNA